MFYTGFQYGAIESAIMEPLNHLPFVLNDLFQIYVNAIEFVDFELNDNANNLPRF